MTQILLKLGVNIKLEHEYFVNNKYLRMILLCWKKMNEEKKVGRCLGSNSIFSTTFKHTFLVLCIIYFGFGNDVSTFSILDFHKILLLFLVAEFLFEG